MNGCSYAIRLKQNSSLIAHASVKMEVANNTDAGVDIRNIGVLMFTERPDKLIPGAQIDLVRFNTEEALVNAVFHKLYKEPKPVFLRY